MTLVYTLFKTLPASYAGTAPFPAESGRSIKRGKRVHGLAHKGIKALLSNAAVWSIAHNQEMGLYDPKKVQERKHKTLVEHNIRNKNLARVLGVVKRGNAYASPLGYAA